MPRYRHPRALGVDDPPQIAVDIGGEHVDLDADGCFETDNEAAVRAIAAAHGVTVDDLALSDTCDVELSDGGVCGRDLPCQYHTDGGDS